MRSGEYLQGSIPAAALAHEQDWLRRRLAFVPRPLRFLGVGSLGLTTDLAIFTAIPVHAQHPLMVRLVSLACATLVTPA